MIKVLVKEFGGQIDSLRLSGHADFGPWGEDLVCAGVSSIMIGALNAIDQLAPSTCFLTLQDNLASIQRMDRRDDPVLQSCLQMLLIQLQTVQERYPDHIRLEMTEEEKEV